MKRKPIGWLSKGRSVVLMGLDYAGKTSLVDQWTRGVTEKTSTTIGLDIEHVEILFQRVLVITLRFDKTLRAPVFLKNKMD